MPCVHRVWDSVGLGHLLIQWQIPDGMRLFNLQEPVLRVREQSAGRAVNEAFKHCFKSHAVKYLQDKDLNESIVSISMLGMVPLSFL